MHRGYFSFPIGNLHPVYLPVLRSDPIPVLSLSQICIPHWNSLDSLCVTWREGRKKWAGSQTWVHEFQTKNFIMTLVSSPGWDPIRLMKSASALERSGGLSPNREAPDLLLVFSSSCAQQTCVTATHAIFDVSSSDRPRLSVALH